MNLLSNNNHILRGAAIPTAGGDVYNSGWEYTPEGEISGYSGSAIYTGEGCTCDSAAIVDSAFNKSTAWVDEQNYLTAHQDVDNLPYVQNSALEFSPQSLISGISGSGFYAASAEGAFIADTANYAYNAEYADSADYARSSFTAQFANSASSALNSEVANVAYTALTAHFLDEGWERDVDGFITAYNNSAFAGAGGRYEGISPIVVNNEEMRISAKSALLGVQDPLYFVEDSETATVIGIHDSAFPTFETNSEGEVSAINGSAIYATDVVEYSDGSNISIVDHVISVTGSVPSADRADYAVSATSSHFSHSAIEAASAGSATYDNLGREITATYLTAVTGDNTPYTQGPNIDITNHVVSGKDWTSEIQAASANAVNEATNTITAVEFANSASALTTSAGWDITEYTDGANIDITNHVVSGKDWSDNITAASSYAYEQATAQIPDVTNLPYVQNTALESNGILISAISGSGLYATSAENAFEADHAYEADYVLSGWEYDEENRISAYNGSAFAGQGGGQGVEYTGIAPIVVNNVEHKISAQSAVLGVQSPLYFVEDSVSATVIGIDDSALSGRDWSNDITAASSYAYEQATAQIPSELTGTYVPLSARDCIIGSANTAEYDSFAQGYSNRSFIDAFTQGDRNTATNTAMAQGLSNSADNMSFAQGYDNTAVYMAISQGYNNIAYAYSFAQGYQNHASGNDFAQGQSNSANALSLAQGHSNTAEAKSLAQGYQNKAYDTSIAQGSGNSAYIYSQAFGNNNVISDHGMAIGQYNKTSANVAFVIGNGTAEDARSDLFLIFKNGSVSASGNISANGYEMKPIAVVTTSAQATGSNILYIVTGS